MKGMRSLEKRFILFLFVPVILLLTGMGTAGFWYARRTMLQQWEDAALLRLQRAAHFVDMRLSRPKELIALYLDGARRPMGAMVSRVILEQLKQTPGIVSMRVFQDGAPPPGRVGPDASSMHMHRRHHGSGRLTVTLPHFNTDAANEVVSLIARVVDDRGRVLETLEVVMDFRYLIEDLPRSGWWETQKAFLVDEQGRILVSGSETPFESLAETGSPLARTTLAALRQAGSGTRRGEGHPPDEISGFYRLMEAPWYVVVFAPGEEILGPIVGFRNVYFIIMGGCLLTILLLIRMSTSRVTRSVKDLSVAADQIAGGTFGEPLPQRSRDEIGELIRSFNTMSQQLRERMQMKRSLDLAKEVQQNLIPTRDPTVAGLDVSGRSEFCDETGGDYFDYVPGRDTSHSRLRLLIGDVAGHGISSALLMSGVRAGLRQRLTLGGSIEAIVGDVNRQVVDDVGTSGRFMTLFLLDIDVAGRSAAWIRAGHEPALLYRAGEDRFETLRGEGLPLGVDAHQRYRAELVEDIATGDVFILATDGVWEATDTEGRMIGKQPLKALVRAHHRESTGRLLEMIFAAIHRHRGIAPTHDDATLIVAKFS